MAGNDTNDIRTYVTSKGQTKTITQKEDIQFLDYLEQECTGDPRDKQTVFENYLASKETATEKRAFNNAIALAASQGCDFHDAAKFANDYSQVTAGIWDKKLSHDCREAITDVVNRANIQAGAAIKVGASKDDIEQIYKKALTESKEVFDKYMKMDIVEGKDERAAAAKVKCPSGSAILGGVSDIAFGYINGINDPGEAMVKVGMGLVKLTVALIKFSKQLADNREEALKNIIDTYSPYKTLNEQQAGYKRGAVDTPVQDTPVDAGKDLQEACKDLESKMKKVVDDKEALMHFADMPEGLDSLDGITPEFELKNGLSGTPNSVDDIKGIAYNINQPDGNVLQVFCNVETKSMDYSIKTPEGDVLSAAGNLDDILEPEKWKSLNDELDRTIDTMSKASVKNSGKAVEITFGNKEGLNKDIKLTVENGKLSINGQAVDSKRSAINKVTDIIKENFAGKHNASAKAAKVASKIAGTLTKESLKTAAKHGISAVISASNPYLAAAKTLATLVKKIIIADINRNKSMQKNAAITRDEGQSL